MADQKNGNAKENDNIIQGPWPKSKRKVKVPDEEFLQQQENLEFAEELNQKNSRSNDSYFGRKWY